MKREPSPVHAGATQIERLWHLSLLLASVLCCSCVASTWDQLDPEYSALMPQTTRQWDADAIVGVWVCQSQARFGLPARRLTALIKPDRTARMRVDGVHAGDATWTFDGYGTWTLTPYNVTKAIADESVGQSWEPMKVRFTGSKLLFDAPMNGGLWSMGGTIKNHQVFVRADDEAAVDGALQKRF